MGNGGKLYGKDSKNIHFTSFCKSKLIGYFYDRHGTEVITCHKGLWPCLLIHSAPIANTFLDDDFRSKSRGILFEYLAS